MIGFATVPAWMERAACAGDDPSLWYADERSSGGTDWYAEARQVCASCPVTAPCLALADATETASLWGTRGVWGGLSPAERVARRRGLREAS